MYLEEILFSIMILSVPIFIVTVILLVLASKAFLIWMLVDCLGRDEAEFQDKTMWTILLVLGLFFGYDLIVSLVYFFVVKKKLDN